MKYSAIWILLSTLSASAWSQGVLLPDATLFKSNDLTVVRDGSTVYEFLDLTATYSLDVGSAIAKYSAYGFHWATPSEMSSLLSAFGFAYASKPSAEVQLQTASGLPWTPSTWSSASNSFVSHLGSATYYYSTGFVDDQLTPGHSTWLYINPLGIAFTNNEYQTFQHQDVGTFLVRQAATVPEPSGIALFLAGLVSLGVLFRSRRERVLAM